LEQPLSTTADEILDLWGDTIPLDSTPTMTIKSSGSATLSQSKLNIKSYSIYKDDHGAGQYADYEIIKELGRGGIGVVHRARQTSVDRSIAVKMIKDQHLGKPEVHDKFLTEAVVTASLDHPNIVPIYDLGEDDKGHAFYTMKEVKGIPWSETITDKSQPDNLSIFLRVCDALAFSHNQQIIHLDLKPENIILSEFGEVLVMDWGSAASVVEDSKAIYIKNMASVVSSPAYMAPEMAKISVDDIGIRSDIYQLGGILFEILTGNPPHTGTSVIDCLRNAANNIIRGTDQESELMDIALKAMSKNKDDRFQTVKELQEAIHLYEDHHESLSLTSLARQHLDTAQSNLNYEMFNQAVFAFRQAVEMWGENKTALAGLSKAQRAYGQCAFDKQDLDLALSILDPKNTAHVSLIEQVQNAIALREDRKKKIILFKNTALGLGVIIFIIVSISFFWIREEQRNTEAALIMAQEEKDRAESEAQRATSVSHFLTDMLIQTDPTGTGGRHITVLQLVEVMSKEIEQRSGDNLQTQHSLHSTIGRVFLGLGEYDKASVHIQKAQELAEELFSKQSLEYINDLNNMAEVLHKQGKLVTSLPMFLEAERLTKEISNEDNGILARIYDNLAELYLFKGDYEKAKTHYEKALNINKIISGEKSFCYAESLHNYAEYHRQEGNYQEAEEFYLQTLKIYNESIGKHNASYAINLSNLAELYREQGHYTQAEPLYIESLTIMGDVLGENHPNYGICLNNLGHVYYLQADYQKAEPIFQETLEIYRQSIGENHPYYAITLSSLGSIYNAQYQHEKSQVAYKKALQIFQAHFGKQHEEYATALHNLASQYYFSGEYDKAEVLTREALDITAQTQGEEHQSYAIGLITLAEILRAQEHLKEAERQCLNALDIFKNHTGENTPAFAVTLLNLSRIIHEGGDQDKAERHVTRGLEIAKNTLSDSHPYYASGLITLAKIQNKKQAFQQAEKSCNQALDIYRMSGETTPHYASGLYCLGLVYEKQGLNEKAQKYFKHSLSIRKNTLGEEHPDTQSVQNKMPHKTDRRKFEINGEPTKTNLPTHTTQ